MTKYKGNNALLNIPVEIQDMQQWTFSAGTGKKLKAPKDTTFLPNGGKTFAELRQAIKNSKHMLRAIFYATMEDPYILCDYDHVEDPENPWSELPPDLGFMLKNNPTYTELSQSGNGLRFIYKLESADVKKLLVGHAFEGSDVALGREAAWSHICIHKPGMTLTGKILPYSTETVTTITLDALKQNYNLKFKRDQIKEVKSPTVSGKLPSPSDMIKLLEKLPIDANPRIQRAYLKTFKNEKTYIHYKFWYKVMASLKEYSMNLKYDTDILQAFIDWSAKDEKHYDGIDTVQKHWVSFKREEGEIITFRSLIALYKNYQIDWKIPKAQSPEAKKAGVPKQPLLSAYDNFKQALDHYNIKIYGNEIEHHVYYLTGDCDILDADFQTQDLRKHFNKYYGPYSESDLISLFAVFLQSIGFTGISNHSVKNHLANHTVKTVSMINFVKLYIDTLFSELPSDYKDNSEYHGDSTLDAVWNCLTPDWVLEEKYREQEEALYKSYLKKWFMGILRGLYYTGRFGANNCMLVLTGPESANKSSFFALALPEFFSHLIGKPGHGFATPTDQRDLSKLACEHLILTWDDSINRHLNNADVDMFKAAIENGENTFIDKWDKNKTRVRPLSIYGATSNKREFKMSDEGNRRLFIIPVTEVDTVALPKICWHPIFNQLKKDMFEGITEATSPWLLTKEEIKFQTYIHGKFKAVNSIDILLDEMYDTTREFKISSDGSIKGVTNFRLDESGTLKTMQKVIEDIEARGIDTYKLTQNRAALRKALIRLCSAYTGTQSRNIICTSPRCIIKRGEAIVNGRKKWVMPPLADDYSREDYDSDETDLT